MLSAINVAREDGAMEEAATEVWTMAPKDFEGFVLDCPTFPLGAFGVSLVYLEKTLI